MRARPRLSDEVAKCVGSAEESGVIELEEKKRIHWSHILHVLLSFLVIYLISIIFVASRIAIYGGNSGKYGAWEFFQLLVYPGLFLFAGYAGTSRVTKKPYSIKWGMLFAVLFSGSLLAVWYVSVSVSAVLNLIPAQACYGIDHLMRGYFMLYGDEYTYLGRTDMYLYFILPVLYFFANLLYWACFLWGNRLGCPKAKKKKKKKKKQY